MNHTKVQFYIYPEEDIIQENIILRFTNYAIKS